MVDSRYVVDIVTWHRHWPQPGPALATCHVSPASLAACPRSRHHVSLLLMATRSPHVSPPSHTGQHVPGRCWGRAQGSGGQSWGQQSTSPCWTDTGCSVFSVQGVYNHTNIYTQLSLRSNRTHAHITRCWCTLLQHYIAQVSKVCTIGPWIPVSKIYRSPCTRTPCSRVSSAGRWCRPARGSAGGGTAAGRSTAGSSRGPRAAPRPSSRS